MHVFSFTLCLIVYCVYSIPVVQSNFIIPEFTKYGVNSDFRIIGGSPVKVGEFPGQVSLQNRFFAHICAGILIDPLHIVTAAHCNQKQKRIGYVMGDDINVSVNGTKTRQRRKVAHFVTHPEFSRDTFQNDIAVIRVNVPFNITDTFNPMIRSQSPQKTDTRCTVVGWGYTENNQDSDISYNLLKTDVFVADINFCNGSLSYLGAMKPGMFCAGRVKEGGHDACQGDSGGLITCGKTNEISGVVSFGNECGLPYFPGIYSDLSVYNDWIDKTVATKELPEYEHSPFPKPHNFSKFDENDHDPNKNSSGTTDITKTAILISLVLLITSSWQRI